MNPLDQLSSSISDDGNDLDMSNALDAVETANKKKRNHGGVPITRPAATIKDAAVPSTSNNFIFGKASSSSSTFTTAADFFNTSLKKNLKKIDPTCSLSIHKYTDQCAKDIKVKDFCDKLQAIGFVPQVPSSDDIKHTHVVTCEHQLSAVCKSECVSVLMSYFQNAYFINNMENAVINRVSLVNVFAPVYQPCFSFSPEVGLETLTKIRQTCSISLQAAACENAIFIKQLLLVTATHLIFKELLPKYQDTMKLRMEVQSHLHLLYVKAKIEYFNNCKPKSFDWPNMPNKVKPLKSLWRKKNQEPPQIPYNRHALKIMERIKSDKESFLPETVGKEYSQFLEDGEKLVESFKKRKIQKSTSTPSSLLIPPQADSGGKHETLRSQLPSSSSTPAPPPPQKMVVNKNKRRGRKFGLSRKKNSHEGDGSHNPTNSRFPSHSSFTNLADDIA